MRFSVDTGGTFTDLVVELDDGRFEQFKSPTTPEDPVVGVLEVLSLAARRLDTDLAELLGRGELFIHATTRALNAILTGSTAKTGFLTTAGHPDVLLFREGGRTDVFDNTVPYPQPYVPHRLTFEIPERIDVEGRVLVPLDEEAVRAACAELRREGVEAVGVCLLWSTVNPRHELRVGELLRDELPGVAVTLSHALNPSLREYRRASSACIDASLKPLMDGYLASLTERLRAAGFSGRVLMVTSSGGVLDLADVAAAPIHAIGSGPASAPVAARHHAERDVGMQTAIVADSGGTSFDVSVVRHARLPWTRETWIGAPYRGHMTGFPSVDVRSIGAGGGSMAAVDEGGLLRVGPASAGSVPGPVCYGRGGTAPTVTDASVVLGHIDPEYFLGGAMRLDGGAAREAIDAQIAQPLGLTVAQAAAAILSVATENMIRAIESVTVRRGLDPRDAALIGGGGAAGLNIAAIARRLGAPFAVIPRTGATLSAAGALMAELVATYESTLMTTSTRFDHEGVAATLERLRARCDEFASRAGAGSIRTVVECSTEARYPNQVWELEVQLPFDDMRRRDAADALSAAFHATHREGFGIEDPGSPVEFINWRASVRCRLHEPTEHRLAAAAAAAARTRPASFGGEAPEPTPVHMLDSLAVDKLVVGPAIVESPFTTVVIDEGFSAAVRPSGSLVLQPVAYGERDAADARTAAPLHVMESA